MSLPSNVHVSSHPCLKAKLSQLRSEKTSNRETKALVHEIATMIGYEALATGLTTAQGSKVSRVCIIESGRAERDGQEEHKRA